MQLRWELLFYLPDGGVKYGYMRPEDPILEVGGQRVNFGKKAMVLIDKLELKERLFPENPD